MVNRILLGVLLLLPSPVLAAEVRIFDCKGLLRLVEESGGLDTIEMLLAEGAEAVNSNGTNPLQLSSMDGIAPDILAREQVPQATGLSAANSYQFPGVSAGSWRLSRAFENGCPNVLLVRLQERSDR